ncbi:MAG: hypothetical protein HY303_01795 [Candidatus Wallbacteria bacterium]|nr:hypothetical protein [Candidatus Wallbacteria bacterium]
MTDPVGEFERVFRRKPECVASAPGIVNIAGEDSGHDSGLVLALALQQRVRIAVARRLDRRAYLRSSAVAGEAALALDKLERTWGWTDPIAGVVAMLEREGRPAPGFELYVDGTVELGAGLAASAALELALLAALDGLGGMRLSAAEQAGICWRAENEFMGAGEPLTPFLAAVTTREDHAVLVVCHDRTSRVLALEPSEYRFVTIDAGLHKTASQADAQRIREQCSKALATAQQGRPEIGRLRDLTQEDIRGLDEQLRRRCRHVVGEAERTRQAVEALEGGELGALGKLLTASHESLRENLGVEPDELDGLARLAQTAPGVLGARLPRERNAGCLVALVHEKALTQLDQRVRTFYATRHGREARIVAIERAGAGVLVESSGRS